MQRWRQQLAVSGAALLAVSALAACSDDESSSPSTATAADSTSTDATSAPATAVDSQPILFSPEGNNLWAYSTAAGESDPPQFVSQEVNTNHADDPAGWDINGQVCSLPGGRIITGEDTGQPDPPAGWGIFEVSGTDVGDLAVERVGRLVPSFAGDDESPDTYGCGVLSDGRVVTTVIGNNAIGPANGQLVLWYPPFDSVDGSGIDACVLADDIATAQQIWVDADDNIHVASARAPTTGIIRFSPPYPPAEACGDVVTTREQLIEPTEANALVSPNGVVGSDADDILFVSSIFNGVIAEFDREGTFRRLVLEPAADDVLGAEPYLTGTPLGLALGDGGTLYFADLGLVVAEGELPGPGPGKGSVRRIVFVEGEPQPPDVLAEGLTFPDGLGLWSPPP